MNLQLLLSSTGWCSSHNFCCGLQVFSQTRWAWTRWAWTKWRVATVGASQRSNVGVCSARTPARTTVRKTLKLKYCSSLKTLNKRLKQSKSCNQIQRTSAEPEMLQGSVKEPRTKAQCVCLKDDSQQTTRYFIALWRLSVLRLNYKQPWVLFNPSPAVTSSLCSWNWKSFNVYCCVFQCKLYATAAISERLQ